MKIQTLLVLGVVLLLAACTKDQMIAPAAPANAAIESRDIDYEDIYWEDECPCAPVQSVSVGNVTSTSAAISWIPSVSCGKFSILIYNLTTGTYQYITNIVGYSYQLTGLLPCSDYEIAVGHEGSYCVAEPVETTFTTECDCPLGSSNANDLYIQHVTLTNAQHPGVWSDDPTQGYHDHTNQTLSLPSNAATSLSVAGICTDGNWGTGIFAQLWIDYNGNGVFEASETAYTYANNFFQGWGALTCLSTTMPNFVTPNQNICGVRARFMLSSDPITGPCAVLNRGQIIDFRVNIGEC
jgi:hypothetical protein